MAPTPDPNSPDAPASGSVERQAAYAGEGRMVVGPSAPAPLGPGEVSIEVAYVGLCGTDLHILHGNMDARVELPQVIGHEMSGTIAGVADDVTDWEPGDRVTVMPLAWDGTCPACLAGNEHICQNLTFIGIDSPGALQSRWTVPASTVVALPESLPLRDAGLVEPVAVAVHDVRRSEAGPGDSVVVLGGGPIGLLIAVVARDAGAEVVVEELDADRAALARDLGFTVIDPRDTDDVAWVADWTGGAGADIVFEVSGAPAAVRSATALAKVRGTIVIVAIHPEPRPVDLQRVFWRELRILGARVYQRTDFERAIELLDSGVIPADRIITGVRDLADVADAFADLEAGDAMKVLISLRPGDAA